MPGPVQRSEWESSHLLDGIQRLPALEELRLAHCNRIEDLDVENLDVSVIG